MLSHCSDKLCVGCMHPSKHGEGDKTGRTKTKGCLDYFPALTLICNLLSLEPAQVFVLLCCCCGGGGRGGCIDVKKF